MDRERRATIKQTTDTHLIMRGHGLELASFHDRERCAADSHGSREFPHFTEAVAQRIQGVAQWDREHGSTVFDIGGGGFALLHFLVPAPFPTPHRGRQHAPHIPLFFLNKKILNPSTRAALPTDTRKAAL